MKNLYSILKINKNASLKEIKKAYHKLAIDHHPDKNAGQESQEFLDINTAYTILKDKVKRTEYNKTGKIDMQFIDIRRLALQDLASLLLEIIKNPHWSFQNNNLFDQMRESLLSNMRKMEDKKAAVSAIIERLESVNSRISGKDSLFNDIISSDLNLQKLIQAKIKHEKNILEEAQKILKDYKYKVDQQRFINQMMFDPTMSDSTMATKTGY